MTKFSAEIVKAAVAATTPEEASDLQALIALSIGGEYIRPLGDRPNNYGTLASAADYDLKLVETITNMQDAVVDRAALAKYGSREGAAAALRNPRDAAAELLGDKSDADLADLAQVTFHESDPPTDKTLKFTAVFRDKGTGISNSQIPKTIFGLGGSYKEDAAYLQGAFGLGGELTYRNADYVVLVTRKAPELLVVGEEDRISVAVVEWRRLTKVESAYYLVDAEWDEPGDIANPWSCSASEAPAFEPGTHLALISYKTKHLHRQREGDARSFDTIINTRLVRPVFPVRWRNYLARGAERSTVIRGLESRLDNTDYDFTRESATMPFIWEGKTFLLDIGYTLFNEPNEKGKRASFVAYNHAVLFTSNGQVQNHWTPAEFRQRTKLKKLDQRVLVEVNLDALPIAARTSLFTADRAETVKSEFALRLESQVLSFVDEWDSLRDENRLAVEKQIRSATKSNTRGVSDKIRRAFAVRGFGASAAAGVAAGGAGGGGTNSGGSSGGKRKVLKLNVDPTLIAGPSTLNLVIGETRFVSFTVDALDEFFNSGRGEIEVSADDNIPFELNESIAIGLAHNGYFRVGIGVPDGFEPAEFAITFSIKNWTKASGGLGANLEHTCVIQLVTELPGKGAGAGAKPTGNPGKDGVGQGSNVVLLWDTIENRNEWTAQTVGQLELVEAQSVANTNPDFADLLKLGSTEVQCLILNSTYGPLVSYLNARAQSVGGVTIDEMKARYAIGVGVEMLVLDEEAEKLAKNESVLLNDDQKAGAYRAAARGTLAILPDFDDLAKIVATDE
ncbi:hypothetical protein EYE40_08550 [Glaciihabitans arcticus]|uniref:Uncharacterized protein n=1 Tax=Glaciihabitans arcticus TaxID=2668039 RepID=A0A4Q9GR77_9MICO|nr:hypothetical protein [Glaciihabitans arcticus]TBN57436.1 hypothetical protein EYE40_08550 [Glaciihabitans arcticus]